MDVILHNLPYMLRGLEITLVLSLASLVGSVVLGTGLAMLRMSPWRIFGKMIGVLIDLMRMTPLLMVIFWIFFLIPIMTGHPVAPITAALWALIIFNASYMAEIIRAGIEAVPRGLSEASRALGLSYPQSMTNIVLPLAFKSMLPAMVNRLVTVIMATSLAYTIGVTEFFRAASDINNRVFRPFSIYIFVGIVYFVLCYSLSMLGRSLERRLGKGDRALVDP